ncbi:MAG: hypothetical protein HKN08_01020 [Gammaproteobacteria bacterium]|nr:hypothetical protein [Gammaproteobacteria bacterium]
MPLWIKNSLVVILSIFIAAWFAGEQIRIMDEHYFLNNIREDKSRLVQLLSGLVANEVVLKNEAGIDAVVKDYLSNWPEITYVHILDDRARVVYDWQKKPVQFGPTIRSFQQLITVGGQEFGTLIIYFDLVEYFEATDEHIRLARQSAAAILLAITMFLVFVINFVAKQESEVENQKSDLS